MDRKEMIELVSIAVAAGSLVDRNSGVIRATTESVDARAREISYKVHEVLRWRGDKAALED